MQAKRNFSAKREAIYKAIASTKLHPSAEWIYEQLKPEIPDLSLGTVYRNLNVFKQNGKIKSLGVFNGQERFDYDTSEHAHFVCIKCFDIEDIPNSKNLFEKNTYEYVEKKCSAQVTSHSILFYGLCHHCRQQNPTQECQYPTDI